MATGEMDDALAGFPVARAAWTKRGRFWEGNWAALDLARCTAVAGRTDAGVIADAARSRALEVGATTLVRAAEALLRGSAGSQPRWHPLTAREYAVATLVSTGMTNREIAVELVLAPKTVSAHVEHILAKLGASRRAEIAAWVARQD
ncbi:MAG TPA: LuxR C-terminal-related transcriptional regulator [Acidothermaceae bacterium]|nr:LuxR C-terminal-related transcriptional regulator [Acidothermaceae bacterium]